MAKETKKFKPHFSEIRQENKDILYIVHYAKDSTIKVIHVYNSIGQSYMGVEVEAFVETLRGLLREFPDFLEVLGHDPRKELAKLGFVQMEPTDMELMLYK